jgi:signal transduction histidine kinase
MTAFAINLNRLYLKDDLYMFVNDQFFKNLPFPYLLIREDGWIIQKSLRAQSEFPSKETFQELIEPTFVSLVDVACLEPSRIELEIPLLTMNNQYIFYRVFRLLDEMNGFIHLFIIPLSDRLADIEAVIKQIESKFTYFQQEIKENKQYIDQTVSEIQGATVTNQNYQNIERLAAGIAHEIRNPLTTVGGFIQLLKPYLIDIGKEQYVDIVLDELNRANQIIYEFLNASKPQKEEKISISLNKLVKDISLLYESEAILKDIVIMNHYSVEDIELIANLKQLKQVLVNLLKNAIEALEARQEKNENGIIQFYTMVGNDYATIVVQDNGCGMSEDTMQNLFLPFHTTKASGTGVGLAVCKNIVEEHQGTILVESTLGKGTKFSLIFPLQKSETKMVNLNVSKNCQ